MQRIHVVIGILIDQDQRVCLGLRPSHKHLGDMWEFPGGKVEAAEAPFVALKRELFEELGVDIKAAEPFIQFPHDYPQTKVLLDFWLITEFLGEAHGKEGQPIEWVPLTALNDYALPEANEPVRSLLMKKFS